MMHPSRLAVLLVPIVLGLLAATLPGRAQTPVRYYANADTTLLRDTLGLKFDTLFPLADSLRVTADTLRALSIRYRAPLWRIVKLADSLAVPMDSVAAVMQRERFNPLAATADFTNQFGYNSTYDIQRTSSSWLSGAHWNYVSRALVLNNQTTITMARIKDAKGSAPQQTRDMVTEAGWRFSREFSVGGRAHVYRYDYPASTDAAATTNEFSAPVRFKARPTKNLNTELNVLPGAVDLTDVRQVKRGSSAQVDGRVRYSRGGFLTGDVSGLLSGNLTRTRQPESDVTFRTRDSRRNLSGTLGLFTSSPVGANLNYRLSRSVTETPPALDTARVQQLINQNDGAELTVRGRLDNDRLVNVTGRWSKTQTAQNDALATFTTGRTLGISADGRYIVLSLPFEWQFSNGVTNSDYPRRAATGGYGQRSHDRRIQVSVDRPIAGGHLTLHAKGSVSLTSARYTTIGTYPTPPVDNDRYDQGYRLGADYVPTQDFNTGVALDVQRSLTINIPSGSTGANSQDNRYGADWRWSYRLFPDLTVNQSNGILADYLTYVYRPTTNRLTLLYRTTTTMSAVLSPRFEFSMTHSAVYQPGGNYTLQADGQEGFTKADESKNYTLVGQFSYRPSPMLVFVFGPNYTSSDRKSTQNGALAPSRRDQSFTFSGGATLNVALGSRGKLTGNINRTSSNTSATSWSQGIPQEQPGLSQGFWNGQLQLSWDL